MPAPTLAEAVAQYGRDAYLLTVAEDGPHTSFVGLRAAATLERRARGGITSDVGMQCLLGVSRIKTVSVALVAAILFVIGSPPLS